MAVQTYFKSNNLAINFKVDKLSWHEVLISDIEIENGIYIQKIHLVHDLKSAKSLTLKSLNINITSIDIVALKNTLSKLSTHSATPSTETPLRFANLKSYCDALLPIDVQLHVQTLLYANTRLPFQFHVQHKAQSTQTEFVFSGEDFSSTSSKDFQMVSEKYNGTLKLLCAENAVSLSSSGLSFRLHRLVEKSTPLFISNSNWTGKNIQMRLTEDDQLYFKTQMTLNMFATAGPQKIHMRLPDFLVHGHYDLRAPQNSRIEVQSNRNQISKPHSLNIESATFTAFSFNTSGNEFKGLLKFKDIVYKNSKQEPLISDWHMNARVDVQKAQTVVAADLSNSTHNLLFKNLQLVKKEKALHILLDKNRSQIRLDSNITDLLPKTKEALKSASGVVSFSGHLVYDKDIFSGKLNMDAKNIHLKTDYGNVSQLDWNHDIIDFKKYASGPHKTLTAKEINIGTSIHNVSLEYQVRNIHKIAINKMHFEYEDAAFDSASFFANPLQKEIENLSLQIKNFKLEKFLVLSLGSNVKADGTLSGNVNINIKAQLPSIEGTLNADRMGWIQYRKDGDIQHKNLQLADSPMTILNNYLYNFHYTSLNLDLSSDTHYQMAALFKAYGHNPDYLKGTPLKLNITLEQNILGAIQSMMLSYNLPVKLKEKLEEKLNTTENNNR